MTLYDDESGSAVLQVMSCGNCGADVPITSPATVTVACEHCGTLLLRGDVDLETIGEVALAAPLVSNFQIGTEGYFDRRRFVVRGQLQLDHGAGLWNEWAAETDEGWIWIAEAQGEIHVYEEVELPEADLPSRDRLPILDAHTGDMQPPKRGKGDRWSAGDGVPIGNEVWTIVELGRGHVVACRGEFPIQIEVGVRTTYADLARGGKRVATLDFTRSGPPEFLSGVRVDLAALQLDPSTLPDHRPDRIESVRVKCNECGGTIEVQDADRALTLGCVHCGALLSRARQTEAYHAVEGERKIKNKPAIPIGSRATLFGEDVIVLGYMRRGVLADGKLWPWQEYLLRAQDGGYRWLVESDGHWTMAGSTSPASVQQRGAKLRVGDLEFRHFSGGKAVVDTVLGEFYWQVKSGDATRTDDYVNTRTSTLISLEADPLASAVSRAIHVDASTIEKAFPAAKLPKPKGVGIIQPNPVQAAGIWKAAFALIVLFFGSCVAVRVHHANEVVFSQNFGPTESAVDKEKVEFSEPFVIERGGANVEVSLAAPSISQGYLAVLGALVNEDSGEVFTFETAAQYYSGSSGGESWSEGNRKGSTLIGRVPRGRYRMRIASRAYDRATSTPFQISVKSQVPRLLWFFLGLLALIIYPVIQSIRAGAFEARRWSNSDHAG
ncbi:hypothetical protein Poly30_22310 [Planctomycetes bacterium Poly30]|uniref:DUF4178 domain-containing protein n=1 Tax=Saltatorellus ferox TaxID=2528018 RepID=A0A518ERK5_9BACT|nr:hypothetical protein Poly30_22310 [Planctomycetes bacterium Poly30]